MISVIIPAYNNAEDLPITLESVFAQDFTDIEVIVVNESKILIVVAKHPKAEVIVVHNPRTPVILVMDPLAP